MLASTVRLIDGISKWSGLVVAPLVLVYMGILIYEMVARYIFNLPTLWAHEMSTYLFGAQFMLGGAYCYWCGAMVNVDVVHGRLKPRARAVVDILLFVVTASVLGAMIWYGLSIFLNSLRFLEHSDSAFSPPLYPLRGVIPFAASIFLLQAVGKLLRDVHLAVTGEDLK